MEKVIEKMEELNEQLENENEEIAKMFAEVIKLGFKAFNRAKKRIFARGFMMGALAAVAIQSILTILVMIK